VKKVKSSDVIAIDGPAASGKSTIANLLAERLHIPYINTGNMYRAVTLKALRENLFTESREFQKNCIIGLLDNLDLVYREDESGKKVLFLNGENIERLIRNPEVSEKVSFIATLSEIRSWLVEQQRSYAASGMIVMEGRDIGTVVFPEAKYKFYLTASPEVRAMRRLEQKGEGYDGVTLEKVAVAIAERDRIDMQRKISPLKCAKDAFKIDTTGKSIEEVIGILLKKIESRRRGFENA